MKMTRPDTIADLRRDIETLKRAVDQLRESLERTSRAIESQPSFVDALLDRRQDLVTRHEISATEALMRERIRRRARLYSREEDHA